MSSNLPWEKASETINIIEEFAKHKANIEELTTKNENEKRILRSKIVEYAKIIYSNLFEWAEQVNKSLERDGDGRVSIQIDDEQPYLFPLSSL